jgi:hypothetical protein
MSTGNGTVPTAADVAALKAAWDYARDTANAAEVAYLDAYLATIHKTWSTY